MMSEPGKGTTFNVYLPTIDTAAPQKEVRETDIPRGTERILVVDDEASIIHLLKKNLASLGYRVTSTQESKEALEMVSADPEGFDLVITDTTMPHMAGDVLAKKIQGVRPDLPVILCTGYSSRIDEKKAMAMGIRAFLEKPVFREELTRTVRRILDNGN